MPEVNATPVGSQHRSMQYEQRCKQRKVQNRHRIEAAQHESRDDRPEDDAAENATTREEYPDEEKDRCYNRTGSSAEHHHSKRAFETESFWLTLSERDTTHRYSSAKPEDDKAERRAGGQSANPVREPWAARTVHDLHPPRIIT